MNLDNIDLSNAIRVYSLSNTPLFLIRKLQSDPLVQRMARTASGEDLIAALRRSLAAQADEAGGVRPFVYLVALWLQPDASRLRDAAVAVAAHGSWHSYIASALVETHSPVQVRRIDAPGYLPNPQSKAGSPAANNSRTINT
jgi:hypothetical protein